MVYQQLVEFNDCSHSANESKPEEGMLSLRVRSPRGHLVHIMPRYQAASASLFLDIHTQFLAFVSPSTSAQSMKSLTSAWYSPRFVGVLGFCVW